MPRCEDSNNYIERAVCKINDMKNDTMKEFPMGEDGSILLIRQNNEFSAIGAKCTHYGAPLHLGVLACGRVRCPWHGACFNTKTGDIEDYPGLDSLPKHHVKLEDCDVVVRARRSALRDPKRKKYMCKRDCENNENYVLIGGGPASGVCAEVLRQEGFTGRIIMICKNLPFDRPKLSKNFSINMEQIIFRCENFYKKYGIDVLLEVQAISINTLEKIVKCSNGKEVRYNKLLIATGAAPKTVVIPGINLKNVLTIRDLEDVKYIDEQLHNFINVVCLGAGFICLESAAYMISKAKSVTIISSTEEPMCSAFGIEIGKRIRKLFEERKVRFFMKMNIKECNGKDGEIVSVTLTNDLVLPCDVLIVGVGARSNTDFLKDSGIEMNTNGSVNVDLFMMTNVKNVYAAGDVANAPIFCANNEKANIGHYQIAEYHGRIAAFNMCSKDKPLRAVPFFWTMLFGIRFTYCGYGKSTEMIIHGNIDELNYIAYFLDEKGYVVSASSAGRHLHVIQYQELRSQGRILHKTDITAKDPLKWTEQLLACEMAKCIDSEFIEQVVCKVYEIENDQMKQFDLCNLGKILLIRQENQLYALGANCTHLGAPLHTGVLSYGRVRCQWHGACYNIKTGDIEDYPGLDSIQRFDVDVKNNSVIVRAKKTNLQKTKRIKAMCKGDPEGCEIIVLVGGGPVSGICAEVLRQQGFTGRIIMICKNFLPYDKTKMLKKMDIELHKLLYRCEKFYNEYTIEILMGIFVKKVDFHEKTLCCSNGEFVSYTKLLIATGAIPCPLSIPGINLENVLTLNNFNDVQSINEKLSPEINVVFLGTGFISVECSSYMTGKVKSISIVGKEAEPLAHLGEKIGAQIRKILEINKIKLFTKLEIKECLGENGKIKFVQLSNGTTLPCDILILTIGVKSNTGFLRNSGIKLNDKGSIIVDKFLRTNVKNVLAAGDVAFAPIFCANDELATVTHYQVSQYHGRIAGFNLCDKWKPLKTVPFFWTKFFGTQITFAGFGIPAETLIHGCLRDLKFVAYYLDDKGNVISVSSIGQPDVVIKFQELRYQGKKLHKDDLKVNGCLKWTEKLSDHSCSTEL